MQQANQDQDQHGSVKDQDTLIEHSAETYYLLLFNAGKACIEDPRATCAHSLRTTYNV